MAGSTITPIIGRVHWDDIEQVWRATASYQEKDTGGSVPWKEVIETFLTLAQAIAWLLSVFAPPGSTVTAQVGDLAGLSTYLTARIGDFTQGSDVLDPSPVAYPGADFTAPPYDGHDDSPVWGGTA